MLEWVKNMYNQENVRSKITKEKILKALLYLLKHKKFNEIYVKDICKVACINRSSFYEHYRDINDLMNQVEEKFSQDMRAFFPPSDPFFKSDCFVKMFTFIKDNKEFYTAYLNNNENSLMGQKDFLNYLSKLNNGLLGAQFGKDKMIYHMAFFSSGLQSLCKVWLNTGLKESPEEMANIIMEEYSNRK